MTKAQRRKQKRVRCQKRFSRPNNIVLKVAKKMVDQIDGSTPEEKLGQVEQICGSEWFQRKFPGFQGKDIASVAMQLIE